MHVAEALDLIKNIALPILPVLTFFVGLIWPHVQKPVTDYRQTLTDISQKMLCSVPALYADPSPMSQLSPAHAEARKLYDDIRSLHARLLSSADSIPRFARPVFETLGLLRPRAQIEEGAKMLIGISNQVMSTSKDHAHVTELIKRLGIALDITV